MQKRDHDANYFVGEIGSNTVLIQFKCTLDRQRLFSRFKSTTYTSFSEAQAAFLHDAENLVRDGKIINTQEYEISELRKIKKSVEINKGDNLSAKEEESFTRMEDFIKLIYPPENIFSYKCDQKMLFRIDLKKEDAGAAVEIESIDTEVAPENYGALCKIKPI